MAGPPFARLGSALGLSVLAHMAALGALAWALHAPGAASVSGRKGGITVTLINPALHGTATRAAARSKPVKPSNQAESAMTSPAQQRQRTAGTPQPPPVEAPREVSGARTDPVVPEQNPQAPPPALADTPEQPPVSGTAQMAAAPPAASAIPASRPGAQFASLFAPIVARPMGRGRWRSASTEQAHRMDAHMQREQALQGLRHSLQDRIGAMQLTLVQLPLSGHCEMRTDLARRLAQVRCTEAADEPRLWTMLSGIATAGTVAPMGTALVCMQAQGHEITAQDCMAQDLIARQPAAPSP